MRPAILGREHTPSSEHRHPTGAKLERTLVRRNGNMKQSKRDQGEERRVSERISARRDDIKRKLEVRNELMRG